MTQIIVRGAKVACSHRRWFRSMRFMVHEIVIYFVLFYFNEIFMRMIFGQSILSFR